MSLLQRYSCVAAQYKFKNNSEVFYVLTLCETGPSKQQHHRRTTDAIRVSNTADMS